MLKITATHYRYDTNHIPAFVHNELSINAGLPEGFTAHMVQHVVKFGISSLGFYGMLNGKPHVHWVSYDDGKALVDYMGGLEEKDGNEVYPVAYFTLADALESENGVLGSCMFDYYGISFEGVATRENRNRDLYRFLYFFDEKIYVWREGYLNEDNVGTAVTIRSPEEVTEFRKDFDIPVIPACLIGRDDRDICYIESFVD